MLLDLFRVVLRVDHTIVVMHVLHESDDLLGLAVLRELRTVVKLKSFIFKIILLDGVKTLLKHRCRLQQLRQ